jgi:hypothetical protein
MPALPHAILNNWLLGVVLGMSEEVLDREHPGLARAPCQRYGAGNAAAQTKEVKRPTIPAALSPPAASHIPQRA